MKTVVFTSLVVFALFVTSAVSAQTDNTGLNFRAQRIQDRQATVTQKQEDRVVRRATRSATIEERRLKRISEFFGKMVNRIEAHIARLEKLTGRINSRIAKIEEADPGLGLTEVKSQVQQAQDLLDETKTLVDNAIAQMAELVVSDSPKSEFENVRVTISQIRGNLVEVHRLLVHVIGGLKGLRVGPTNDSSLSAEPTDLP